MTDVTKSVERIFGDDQYLKFGWTDEETVETDAKEQIFASLQTDCLSSSRIVAGKAFFELAIAYSHGFGRRVNVDMALQMVVKAAEKNYLPAMAIFSAWHNAHSRDVGVDDDIQLDWLYDATCWGSSYAGDMLRRKSTSDYMAARKCFHRRGGYNQYFYGSEVPAHIGSEEYVSAIHALHLDLDHKMNLLQSAAIYGQVSLAKVLLQDKSIDINMANEAGETLLFLCCKGGHIDLLEVHTYTSCLTLSNAILCLDSD